METPGHFPTCDQLKPHKTCEVSSHSTYLAGSKVTKARGSWLLLEQGPIHEPLEMGTETHCSPRNLSWSGAWNRFLAHVGSKPWEWGNDNLFCLLTSLRIKKKKIDKPQRKSGVEKTCCVDWKRVTRVHGASRQILKTIKNYRVWYFFFLGTFS